MNLTKRLLILLLFVCNINYSQEWIRTDITEFASIDFPIASELIEIQRETVFTADDEFAFYVVGIRKFTDQQSSQITEEEIPDLYQGFADGAIAAANGELVSKNIITIHGIPALELEYFAPENPQLPAQRFKRIIYVNQNVISIDFWPLIKEKDVINDKKAKFFNSFLINSNKVESNLNITSDIAPSTAFETGVIVGQVFFYLMLIVFFIGLFLLIRYLINKTKPMNSNSHSSEKPKIAANKIICKKCDSENSSNSKYCTRCGFELPNN